MKKIFIPVVAALVASCGCKVAPTKVENNHDCHCLICEACDSIDSLEIGLAWVTMKDNNGKEFQYVDWVKSDPKYTQWRDSLTTLLIEEIDSWPVGTAKINSKDLANCGKLMRQFDKGYDGLCAFEAYPKRFGKDAYKWYDTCEGERLYVLVSVQKEMEEFQLKVDTLYYELFGYEENLQRTSTRLLLLHYCICSSLDADVLEYPYLWINLFGDLSTSSLLLTEVHPLYSLKQRTKTNENP